MKITKEMRKIEAEYNKSMELYEKAVANSSSDDSEGSKKLFSQVADIQYRLSRETKDFYPTQIILATSAARCAMHAERYDFVRQIASEYLLNPQPEYTEHHAKLKQVVDQIPKGLSL